MATKTKTKGKKAPAAFPPVPADAIVGKLEGLLASEFGFGGVLGNVFKCMEEAEEIINVYLPKSRFKEENSLAFKLACPPPSMRNLSMALYRNHVGALCTRIKVGQKSKEDLGLATDAEIVANLYHASLLAPLVSVAAEVYAYLFNRIMPPDVSEKVGIKFEPLSLHAREELDSMRRKCAVDRFAGVEL